YFASKTYHLGLNQSIPSTVIAVVFPKMRVISPKGPLSLLTTKITSAFEKQACRTDKKELVNWLSDLVSNPGIYTKSIPFTCLGLCSNSGLWQYTVSLTPLFTRRSP